MSVMWAAGVVLVLLAAASYEGAIALQWLDIRPQPGAGRAEEERVLAAAIVAQIIGAVVAAARVFASRHQPAAVEATIPLAAAAFLTARFSTFDPYYAPTLRRYSDGGLVASGWVLTLVACSVVAAALMLARPRVGAGVALVVVPLCAFTAFVLGLGH